MTTPELETPVQPLFIAAYAFFVTGALLFIAAFVLTLPAHLFKSTLILSASFAALSTGEQLNHPRQKLVTRETVQSGQEPQYHRNRNPCSLGNLFDIVGLLLLFIAISSFFFPH